MNNLSITQDGSAAANTLRSELIAVFGETSTGDTPDARAKSSTASFVRSQHQLSRHRPTASGRVLTAQEALQLFGWKVLKDLIDRQATPILCDASEPYQSINRKLKQLGLTLQEVALLINWPQYSVLRFERRSQVPFRDLERLAEALGLDATGLGIRVLGQP